MPQRKSAEQRPSNAVDRRRFLTSAALGGATIVGASALGGLDAESAFAAPTPSLDAAISETAFAEGRITAIKGRMLYVAGSWGESHRIQATTATSVWKVRDTTFDAAEVGDGLYARGVEMPDGSIAADAIWINIVNLFCTIKGIGKDRLQLLHGDHHVVGRIEPGSTVASAIGRTPSRDLSILKINQPVQVLGAWRPSDDTIDVVRMWVGHA